MDFSQPVVAFLLGLCGVGSGVLGTWLAFRGKQADQKLLARQQSHTELAELADTRLEEITRKDLRIAALEGALARLWEHDRRLLDQYYRHRREGSPDPEPQPRD